LVVQFQFWSLSRRRRLTMTKQLQGCRRPRRFTFIFFCAMHADEGILRSGVAVATNALLALLPTNRMVPTTSTKMRASNYRVLSDVLALLIAPESLEYLFIVR
jgi:hypothetical protein